MPERERPQPTPRPQPSSPRPERRDVPLNPPPKPNIEKGGPSIPKK